MCGEIQHKAKLSTVFISIHPMQCYMSTTDKLELRLQLRQCFIKCFPAGFSCLRCGLCSTILIEV